MYKKMIRKRSTSRFRKRSYKRPKRTTVKKLAVINAPVTKDKTVVHLVRMFIATSSEANNLTINGAYPFGLGIAQCPYVDQYVAMYSYCLPIECKISWTPFSFNAQSATGSMLQFGPFEWTQTNNAGAPEGYLQLPNSKIVPATGTGGQKSTASTYQYQRLDNQYTTQYLLTGANLSHLQLYQASLYLQNAAIPNSVAKLDLPQNLPLGIFKVDHKIEFWDHRGGAVAQGTMNLPGMRPGLWVPPTSNTISLDIPKPGFRNLPDFNNHLWPYEWYGQNMQNRIDCFKAAERRYSCQAAALKAVNDTFGFTGDSIPRNVSNYPPPPELQRRNAKTESQMLEEDLNDL